MVSRLSDPVDRYVAFIDILGFSALVENDWERARTLYESLVGRVEELEANFRAFYGQGVRSPDPDLQIISDSIIIIGEDLHRVGHLVQAVQSVALLDHDLLVRGCIAHGKHAHSDSVSRTLVVSVPLAAARPSRANH